MKRSIINEYADCSSVRIRQQDGSLFEIPIVDNKGVFLNFFKTNEEFNYRIITLLDEEFTYGLYKKHGCIAYLLCAFSHVKELTEEAKNILQKDLPYILEILNEGLKGSNYGA